MVEGGGLFRAPCPPPCGSLQKTQRWKLLQAISPNLLSVRTLPCHQKEFLATFQQPAPASCKSWWRGEDYYGLLPSTLRVVAKNATLEIAPGDFPEPLIGSNPPLSPEGVFSHFSVACTCLVQIMVEGGGFEPPKSKQQIYSLPPLAAREPLRKLEAAYFA